MKCLARAAALLALLSSALPAAPATGSGSPRFPFGFIENRGQSDPAVRFIGTGSELTALFESNRVTIWRGASSFRFEFVGSAGDPAIEPQDETGASVNYLRGNDPVRWRTGVPLYTAIRYRDVWPGIDIVYRGDRGHLKADYLIAPGADISRIRLRFDGEPGIAPDGCLRIRNSTGEIEETAPVLYQPDSSGQKTPVSGRFISINRNTIGFEASYDRSKPLVIDPPILFSGYFGGSAQQHITAVAVTWTNQIVVAGWTSSTDLPASNGARASTGGGVDAFVAAFSSAGGQLLWCTYLGGSADDRAFGIAVDRALNIYVTGQTSSPDFPLAGGVDRVLSGPRDAFVTKLTPAGSALVYSSYFGGSGADSASAIALDSADNAIITGDTTSLDLPVSVSALRTHLSGTQDAFVARINAAGNAILSATYFGGAGTEHSSSIQTDAAGHTFIGGSTTSSDLPVLSPYQAHLAGAGNAFLAGFAPDLSALVFSTYLGGSSGTQSSPEQINALAIDPSGDIIAAGTTPSSDFPVTAGAFQTLFGGQTDGFISKFSGTGQLLDSTYLGGSSTDVISAIALDFHGLPYVTGYTGSSDFPVQLPTQNANAGLLDAFAAKMNGSLGSLLFSTYIGGSGSDGAYAIAVDQQTGIVIAGDTGSSDFPASGSLSLTPKGTVSAFITKIAPGYNLGFVFAPYFFRDPWHIRGFTGTALANTVTSFGPPGGLPVIGDWDGTGSKRIGVFQNGSWYLDTNGDGVFGAGDKTVSFGQAGDIPIIGDWDGTGRLKLGLFRAGTFILDLSGHLSGVPTGNPDATFSFGQPGDLPVAADWNGSGTTKVGVFRSGQWLVDYNGDRIFNGSDQTWTYGEAGDLPVTGDWDSSGSAKIGVYRNGLWILDYDGDHTMTSWTTNELVLGYGGPSILFKPLAW